jgi:type 1 glutamine amidotransferase
VRRAFLLWMLPAAAACAAEPPRKIVLLAGPITGHPKETHEYEKSVILVKHLLERSTVAPRVRVEAHFGGWPADETTLDDAAAVVMISDGADRKLTDHPLYVGERPARLGRAMARGCGFVQFHWSTFNPAAHHEAILDWVGGTFDFESGPGPNRWASAIETKEWDVTLPSADHPICRGVRPFRVREEFYHHLKFRRADARLAPIASIGPGAEGIVGWAVARDDGGRGFGFTGGHFFRNWWNADFRTLILNAIVWSAGLEVPTDGVQADPGPRFTALILTGHNMYHDWNAVTAALVGVLEQDPRLVVRVSEKIEDLATDAIRGADVLVLNYNNWDRPGLSDAARENFARALREGKGLAVIHFANGAFHETLPNKASDWPEYRRIVRRVWDHRVSAHDPFGPMRVRITEARHPITAGLVSFDTTDELYFKQVGDEPIEPLAVAASKVTKQDEPMAWAYAYGKGRVFQTVLGHSDESIRGAGALIRRGVVWAAGRENLSWDPPALSGVFREGSPWKPHAKAEGRFGEGLDAREGAAHVASVKAYREPPLTVECWARLRSKRGFNILVAQEPKSSATHWELYTYAGTGALSAYLPGMEPSEIKSTTDICDGRWHHVAMLFDGETVKLFVDATKVADQEVTPRGTAGPRAGLLSVGMAIDGAVRIGCDGLIDDVRLSRRLREPSVVPDRPLEADDGTIGLWNFDGAGGAIVDHSKLKRALRRAPVESFAAAGAEEERRVELATDWTPGMYPLAEAPAWARKVEADWVDGRFRRMETGPFIDAAVEFAPNGRTPKGLAIRVGDGGVLYDRSTMRLRASWSGGFLDHSDARFGLLNNPRPVGTIAFQAPDGPGWARDGSFADPRRSKLEPLPPEWLRYRGLYVHGDRVVLEYTVGGTRVLESPGAEGRDLEIDPCDRPLKAQFGAEEIEISPHDDVVRLRWDWEKRAVGEGAAPLGPLTRGGPRRYPNDLVTRGELGKGDGPFAVDTLTVPYENPYRALMFISGMDFMPGGEIAVSTAHGDVWVVSGVDERLERLTWRRFATGLFQPLGLRVVEGKIVVIERGQLTRLHDLNGDGEADFYENLYNGWETAGDGHAFNTCLQTDSKGDYYFFKAGAHHTSVGGTLLRVPKEGGSHEIVATGFRHPIGLCVGPGDVITGADQQGNWMPASRIDVYAKGGFYGYMPSHHRDAPPRSFDGPICWLPVTEDNSCGGQIWVPRGAWGPLGGRLLHLSWGQCRLFLLMTEVIDGQWQGGAVRLPVEFLSGPITGSFNPRDGHLYVCGLTGWQTAAQADGSLQRVRFTGKPAATPLELSVREDGIRIVFSESLDRAAAGDPARYVVERWNYRWTGEYGSKDYSVADPSREGRDSMDVESARLSGDGREVFLKIADLKPVMQMKIAMSLRSADGAPVERTIHHTIHKLGPAGP